MKSVKHDLLIHYDEDHNVLVFHSVPTSATSELRATSFDGVQSETSYLQSMQPDEAEKKLGNLVFSLTDHNSHKKIGIRDYSAEAKIAHELYIQELEQDAKDGDNDAKYHLYLALHSSALRNRSLKELLRAEVLILEAAAQGNEKAIRSLEDWPLVKSAALRRIGGNESL
jgi:hypothetical protein